MDQKNQSYLRLVVRHREISAFTDVLKKVRHMPPVQKQAWIDANAEAMQSAFSLFVEVSEQTLEEIQRDSDTIELSQLLLQTLREAEQLVTEVFHQPLAQLQS